MTLLQLRLSGFSLVTMLLFTAASVEAIGQEPLNSPTTKKKKSVDELLHDKHAVLSQLVKVQSEAYRRGEASIGAVVSAHQRLLEVDMELATTDADRITLLENAVHLASDLERVVTANFKAGSASQADVLRSQAARIDAEILLLRQRQKNTNH